MDVEGSYLISKINFSSSLEQTNLEDVAKNLQKVGGIFVGTSPLCALIFHGPFCLSLTYHLWLVNLTPFTYPPEIKP